MGIKMNPSTYESLVEENKKWLLANTSDSCERQHILAIMAESVSNYYQSNIRDTLKGDVLAYKQENEK